MEETFQVRQWIGAGGISDHSPVWLNLEGEHTNPLHLLNLMPLGSQMRVSEIWYRHTGGLLTPALALLRVYTLREISKNQVANYPLGKGKKTEGGKGITNHRRTN
jgi:hypothetical protein